MISRHVLIRHRRPGMPRRPGSLSETRRPVMRLEILHVPDCPGAAALEDRLAKVLADYPAAKAAR